MTTRSETKSTTPSVHEKGQRLYCRNCQAEIEIINPTTGTPPDQVLRCCGADMTPMPGAAVNVNESE